MAVKSPGTRPSRRRRTPQDARQEILGAARQLIAERPMHEVTVLAIMERTTLSRKSFYGYFRDRSELIIALVRPLRALADAALAHWADAADPVHAGRDPDPQRLPATIRALVTMNQHSMLALPADATDADLDQLVDTLVTIWERATLPTTTGPPGSP